MAVGLTCLLDSDLPVNCPALFRGNVTSKRTSRELLIRLLRFIILLPHSWNSPVPLLTE
jgi:hypothetical protein